METSSFTNTLLKLDPPRLQEEIRKPKALKAMKPSLTTSVAAGGGSAASSTLRKGAAGTADGGQRAVPRAEDIIGAILPPTPVTQEDGSILYQAVSLQPSSRMDVIQLQEQLDNRLVGRQAKEVGLCAIRSELYTQTFDELIRQVSLDTPERGLMLLRIRDEARQSLEVHRMLYDSARAFGSRKAMVAESGQKELSDAVAKLEREKAELQAEVQRLLGRIDTIEKTSQSERAVAERRHNDQAAFLRKTNQQLTAYIKAETEKASSRK